MNYKQAALSAAATMLLFTILNTFEPTRDLIGGGANKYFG